MAPKPDKAEAIVLNFVNERNRPLNAQNAADALQKALDSLADSGKISFKEYGKQKIYVARQDRFDSLIFQTMKSLLMKEEIAKLQEQFQQQKKAIS